MKKSLLWIVVLILSISMVAAFSLYGCKAEEAAVEEEAVEEAPTEEVPEVEEEVVEEETTVETWTPDPDEASGVVTIWYWDQAGFETMWNKFTEVYPNVELNYVALNSADYLDKIQTSITGGLELPDILLGEIDPRGKLLTFDIWENLDAEPYNVDRSKLMDFVVPLGTNPEGELAGIDNLMCPAGLAYKAPLAKEYFGTDDPDELSAMLPDWDTFIEEGKEVKEKSGGSVYMFATIFDAWRVLFGQNPQPMFDGNKLINIDVFEEVFTRVVEMMDAGLLDALATWSPSWFSSFTDDNHVFYPCSSWGPQFVIQPNDPDSEGRWRVMVPPEGGYYYGGTIWGVWNESKVKDAAWAYINWTIFGDGADVYREELGYFVPRKDLYAGEFDYSPYDDPYFGGQNVKELLFKTIAPELQVRPVTKYDESVNDVINLVLLQIEKEGITADEALQNFKAELPNMIPDVEIVE
ncbi:MAG: extracellular solute-binding protein [Actinobacteria bacterium]|nr:extracellular solute-binding protein [Actinomycetota bacterium]